MFSYALEILFLFFEIKFSGYRDGVSVKLKYLNLYDYIFDGILFIISLEESFWVKRKHASFTPKQILKE